MNYDFRRCVCCATKGPVKHTLGLELSCMVTLVLFNPARDAIALVSPRLWPRAELMRVDTYRS